MTEPAPPPVYTRRWIAAAVMVVAALMDMIDATIVNVALPTIRADLGASATQVEWIVTAYLLPFASFLLVAGRLGDALGRRAPGGGPACPPRSGNVRRGAPPVRAGRLAGRAGPGPGARGRRRGRDDAP